MANAKCIVGNSSSGLRECAFLGTPCVNIGSRQEGREKSDNVIDVNHDSNNIYEAIHYQIKHGKYKKSNIVGDGKSGKKIANYLATCKTNIQKKIHYIKE